MKNLDFKILEKKVITSIQDTKIEYWWKKKDCMKKLYELKRVYMRKINTAKENSYKQDNDKELESLLKDI